MGEPAPIPMGKEIVGVMGVWALFSWTHHNGVSHRPGVPIGWGTRGLLLSAVVVGHDGAAP